MFIALACAALIAWCAPAYAATWAQPNITGLQGSLAKGDGDWLELPWTIVWEQQVSDPRAVERLANGNTLITNRDQQKIIEVSPTGAVVWEYGAVEAGDPDFRPFHATRLPNGNTLIVWRQRYTVIEVTPSGATVWRYGVGTQGFGPGYVWDPFTAYRLPNGNTLIADNQGCRVLEIRSSDYEAGQPDDGYDASSIVWRYGVDEELASDNGFAEGYLGWPKHAVRLANGNTLISDEDYSHRVLEVTPDGHVVWSYGQPGIMGSGPGQLNKPTSAERLADGSTLITDSDNNRVIRVATDGTLLWEYSTASLLGIDDPGLDEPRQAIVTPSGSILIADAGTGRVVELGRAPSGLVTSAQIDCGLPGARKRFSSLAVTVDAPAGTGYTVAYSVDGGSFRTLTGTALPSNTYGKLIRYRVTLTSTRRDLTPRLTGVSIGYAAAPAQAPNTPGNSTGTGGTGTSRRWTGINTGAGTGTGTVASGSKQGGAGYTSGGTVAVSGGLEGALSTQRGWSMASVGTTTMLGARPGSAGAPTPPLGGLLVLGALYGIGAASVPIGQLLVRMLGRTPAPV